MNTLQKFNHNINNSLITNHKLMAPFKRQIDALIRQSIEPLDSKNDFCIIGAGKMQEFSLSFLLSSFQHVLITDIDVETVQNAFNAININQSLKERTHIQRLDVTGFEHINFFNDLATTFQRNMTYQQIDQFVETKMAKIKTYQFLKNQTFDCIYVSPIYTQLVYQQLLLTCSQLRQQNQPEHFIKYLEQLMLDKMQEVIDQFNHNLVSHLKKASVLIVVSDIFEIETGSQFDKEVREALNDDHMDQRYQRYVSEYGMGLGDYGLYSLDQLLNKAFDKWLIWPFSENKQYVVKVNIYNN
ncbi:MAG: hypothetical protein K9L26_02825 [Candidatus Izimaplasma sp.]|nr:hypothetical protein [Candidatus Izimaplasma bacterium]